MFAIYESVFKHDRRYFRFYGTAALDGAHRYFAVKGFYGENPQWSLRINEKYNPELTAEERSSLQKRLADNPDFISFIEGALARELAHQQSAQKPLVLRDCTILNAKTFYTCSVYRSGAALDRIEETQTETHQMKLNVSFEDIEQPILFLFFLNEKGEASVKLHPNGKQEAFRLLKGFQQPLWRERLAEELYKWVLAHAPFYIEI